MRGRRQCPGCLFGLINHRRQQDIVIGRIHHVHDGRAEREVKLRLMEVLFSNEIPDPRDVMLICLADACGIFADMFSRRELSLATTRIEQVRRLDLIGQAMAQAIHDIEITVAASVHGRMF